MKRTPQVLSSSLILKGFFDVKEDLLQRADGHTHPYRSLVTGVDATAIIAQDPEGRWILNREYRHPVGAYLLGCSGGRLEAGEDPTEGARRELLEETGYFAKEMILLGAGYPLPSLCDQKIYYFFAKDAIRRQEPHLDPFEFIELARLTDMELEEEIRTNPYVDGILLTVLWHKQLFSSQRRSDKLL